MLLRIQEKWRKHLLKKAARNISRTLDELRKVGKGVEDPDSGDIILMRVLYNPYIDKLVFTYKEKSSL
jgi:hypothetical protein